LRTASAEYDTQSTQRQQPGSGTHEEPAGPLMAGDVAPPAEDSAQDHVPLSHPERIGKASEHPASQPERHIQGKDGGALDGCRKNQGTHLQRNPPRL
jgi:hypothetical protein